jgi:uncharacterized protein (TIGR00369 family)
VSLAEQLAKARTSGDYNALVDAIPYFHWLGLRVERQGSDVVTIMPFQDMLIGNPMLPALHGGVTGAFLESAAIISLMAGTQVEQVPKIINITVEYLRPGGPTDTVATGVITRQGRRVANVRAEAWQDDRRHPIASASAHFLLN